MSTHQVLLVGDEVLLKQARRELGARYCLCEARTLENARAILTTSEVAAVVVARGSPKSFDLRLLSDVHDAFPDCACLLASGSGDLARRLDDVLSRRPDAKAKGPMPPPLPKTGGWRFYRVPA